ncbi:unnamed protein product [Clonostachys rosea]|uniref:Xylanolytic transcriptional activator regulatory domain-containing protein n=1 Tax=Bionectria ochroleuca TaxID=29856 RepID=A0ABY6U9K0_BIOOC|nr:unnamed protein product [Clonostachys rosea]
MHDLSFILHPSHETSTPEEEQEHPHSDKVDLHQHTLFQQATQSLALSQHMLDILIRIYFDNMVAINLFHQPTFGIKLGNITSAAQICALLAAMSGYSARFYHLQSEPNKISDIQPAAAEDLPGPDHFIDLAFGFIDEALNECGDEQPPLCILQALIVATHCQLARGVHGRAWRSLGLCVRLAYELNLHLVDAENRVATEPEHPAQRRDNEEKRRAWWAIWEMDVFASTIRRTPTAVAWTQMEVLLPVDDSDWFQDRSAPSSFLEPDPGERWRSIQDAGNQSPKAWFLVINSLMKDAQLITSPHGVRCQSQQGPPRRRGSGLQRNSNLSPVEEARHKLEILANAVQCFTMALPQHLRYRSQYLGFEPPATGGSGSKQQLHCGIYNIFVMAQLTRLMIHRYELFADNPASWHGGPGQSASDETVGQLTSHLKDINNASVRQYFEAADNIFMIVNRSSEDHIKHINPFLLSTIWLASAVLLVRQHYGPPSNLPDLVKSRFDVLYLTYKRCISFWDSKTAMGHNLEMLERRLEEDQQKQLPPAHLQGRGKSAVERQRSQSRPPKSCSSWVSERSEGQSRDSRYIQMASGSRNAHCGALSSKTKTHANSVRFEDQEFDRRTSIGRRTLNSGDLQLLDTPPRSDMEDNPGSGQLSWTLQPRMRVPSATMDYLKSSHQQQHQQQNQGHGQQEKEKDDASDLNRGWSVHNFSPMSSHSENPQVTIVDAEMASFMNNPPFISMSNQHGASLVDLELPDMEWRNVDMLMDVQDLLSGSSTY